MTKKILTLLIFFSSLSLAAKNSVKVHYISLSDTTSITANPVKEYAQESVKEGSKVIKIYPEIKHQTIIGIGGCFNEIGGEALSRLDSEGQKEVLTSLFNNSDGANMIYCRMSIGSSDFGIDAYSYSMVADDYQMKKFSVKREEQYMMPYIKKAVETNSDIKIFGSPWSPPAWMKHSGYMDRGVEFPDKNILKDDPKVYGAYALYFAKYVDAYKKEGVKIDRILIQNEQDLNTKYPSCKMPVEQMSHFVQNYMRPLFEKESIDTEIWGGTFRTVNQLEVTKFASSPEYNSGFDGIGIQYTATKYISDIRTLAPNMRLMHTESMCHNGANSMTQARGRFDEVASYINNGSENFAYWNMILNETCKSGWDWAQNSLITINRETKEIIYNPDYAVMNIFSRFIKPGSIRVSAFSSDTTISVEYEGKYYVIVQNSKPDSQTYRCDINGQIIDVEVPSESLSVIEL